MILHSCTMGCAVADEVNVRGFKWERKVDQVSTFHLTEVDHNQVTC